MQLCFHSLSPTGESSEFLYFSPKQQIEELIDLLNVFVRSGFHLFSATITDDEGNCCHLPIGGFEGLPFSMYLIALKRDWEQILAIKPW